MASLYAAPLLRVHKTAVTDAHGTPLATVAERRGRAARAVLDEVAFTAGTVFGRTADVLDPWRRPLFTVSRTNGHLRSHATHVLLPDGATLGTIGIDSRRGRPFYPIYDGHGAHVGEIRSVGPRQSAPARGLARKGLRVLAEGVQSVFGRTFDVTDRLGTVHGRIDPDDQWIPDPDAPYSVRFEPTTPEPLRAVGLAAAVCLSLVRGEGS